LEASAEPGGDDGEEGEELQVGRQVMPALLVLKMLIFSTQAEDEILQRGPGILA